MKLTSLTLVIGSALAVPALAAEAPASPAPAAPAAAPAAPPAAAPAASGSVARAQFTSAVQDREPVDNLTTLTTDTSRIFFFSEIRDLAGGRITHRWEHAGKVMAEVAFDIGGNRWRVHSSKTLDPSWTGEWKVSVVDSAGATLSANTFTYAAAPAAPAAVEPPKAPEAPKAQ